MLYLQVLLSELVSCRWRQEVQDESPGELLWGSWSWKKNRVGIGRDGWASKVVLVVKNPLANAGDTGHRGSIPGLGRSPGGGNGNPLQYSCLENLLDKGAWGGARVHRVVESWTGLKWLSTGIYPREILKGQHEKSHTTMSTTAWFVREKKQKQSECLPMGKEEIHYGASILHRGEIKLHGHLCTNMKQSPKYTVKLEHTHTLCDLL